MSEETLGLLDGLEAILLEGKRIPFMDKIVIDEHELLDVIDKIRRSVKRGGLASQSAISPIKSGDVAESDNLDKSISISMLEKEEEVAQKLSKDTQVYAKQVMTNLQLMVTKMQTNLVKFEKSIEEGRQNIENLTKERKESYDTYR